MGKSGLPRWFFVFGLCLTLVFTAAAAADSPEGTPSKNQSRAAVTEQSGNSSGLLAAASQYMGEATRQISEAGKGLLAIPDLLKQLFEKAQNPTLMGLWAAMAGRILLVLLAGFLAEWITRRILKKRCRSVENRYTDSMAWRGLLSGARIVLEIIPIAAFAAAAYGTLPFTGMIAESRLIALTLINASALARTVLAACRIFLVPAAPSLRLLPVGQESAHYLYIWVRRLVGLGVYGYFFLEAALLAGMPADLHVFLAKFTGLAITAMLVVLVLQNKNEVAGWLHRGHAADETGAETADKQGAMHTLLTLRSRMADFWHLAAILAIVGLFVTWASEIEGGLYFLASGLLMTGAVVAFSALLLRLIHKGVDRMFQISEELKTAYPDLESRANRYQPVVRNALKGVVHLVAIFAVLDVWGLGTLGWLFSSAGRLVVGDLLALALIIAGAFLVWEIVTAMIGRTLARESTANGASTRKLTLLPLLKNVIRITLVLIAAMLVLSQLGINIAPLIAGAGILGLAIGFGAQTLVKDVITGAFILLEDAISVGDWVDAGGHTGTVERLTIRTLSLRDLWGTLHVVPFGDVTTVSNYNRDYGYALMDVGVAYRESYGEVLQALQDVTVELRGEEPWDTYMTGDLEVFGLNKLSDSAVEIRVRIKTLPMRHFSVRRAFLERMKRVFDERGIEIPFPHRTIWFGVDKEGAAPPLYIAGKGPKSAASEQAPTEAPKVQISSELSAARDVMEEAEHPKQGSQSEEKPGKPEKPNQ